MEHHTVQQGCRCAFSQAIFLQHGTIHALQGGNGIKLFKLPDIWIPLERERIESQLLLSWWHQIWAYCILRRIPDVEMYHSGSLVLSCWCRTPMCNWRTSRPGIWSTSVTNIMTLRNYLHLQPMLLDDIQCYITFVAKLTFCISFTDIR